MDEIRCKECEFSKEAHQGKHWCKLAQEFCENLGQFCPKDLNIETIRKSCKYHLPSEKTIGGDAMCRAPSYEHDYYVLCWIKTLEDLLDDPDFKVKKSVR